MSFSKSNDLSPLKLQGAGSGGFHHGGSGRGYHGESMGGGRFGRGYPPSDTAGGGHPREHPVEVDFQQEDTLKEARL